MSGPTPGSMSEYLTGGNPWDYDRERGEMGDADPEGADLDFWFDNWGRGSMLDDHDEVSDSVRFGPPGYHDAEEMPDGGGPIVVMREESPNRRRPQGRRSRRRLSDREVAEAAVETANRRLAQLQAREAEQLRLYGPEPGDGAVVAYTVTYDKPHGVTGVQRYTYAAIREDGHWYNTGREVRPMSWRQLNELADKDSVRVATGWGLNATEAVSVQHPAPVAETMLANLARTGIEFEVRALPPGDVGGRVLQNSYVFGKLVHSVVVAEFPVKADGFTHAEALEEARRSARALQEAHNRDGSLPGMQ